MDFKTIERSPYYIPAVLTSAAVIVALLFWFFIIRQVQIVYSGTLPCHSCAVLTTQLILRGDGTYQLNSLSLSKGLPFTQTGTWRQIRKNNKDLYQLQENNKTISYYKITSTTTIQMVDANGNPLPAPLNITLTKK